jgi:hypothetical protein
MVTTALHQEVKPLETARGMFLELELYPDRLVIKRTDVLSRLFSPEQVISLNDIVAIYLCPARFMVKGWMQMAIMGHNHQHVRLSFPLSEEHHLRAIRETIEDLKSRREVMPVLKAMKPE